MKHRLLILVISVLLCATDNIKAQNYIWKTPQAVTDSLSTNKNPVISFLDYFDGQGYYVLWEKSEDSLSTDIYVKNFYSTEDPKPLIYEGDFHYRNPQIMGNLMYYPSDSMFYLLYESDSSGDNDIYVVKVSASTFSDPVAVTMDTLDDTHMRCNFAGSIVWENNGKILYASIENKYATNWYVSNPIVISDSNSYNPVINCKAELYGREYIAWEQHSDSNIAIYFSYRINPDSSWSDPVMLHDIGLNRNLRFNNDFWSMGIPQMTWDIEENGTFYLMAYDFDQEDFFMSGFFQSTPFHPSIFPIVILVDDFFNESFLAFEWIDNGFQDIFVSEHPWVSPGIFDYINISQSYQVDKNPQLYEGREQSYYKDIILIWESERNNNWQLWSSVFTMPMGGVGKDDGKDLQIINYPNPFTTSTTIKYKLTKPSHVQLTIYNTIGETIHVAEDRMMPQGKHSFTWSPEGLPKGLYYAVMRSEEGVAVVKMVKQ